MKITFLGTGHGNPTLSAYNTSVLLETGGRHYLLDAGEPADASVIRQGLDPSSLSGVFITHAHIDHTGGLPYLCSQACKHRTQFPGIRTAVLVPEKGLVTGLEAWSAANHHEDIGAGEGVAISAYDAGLIYDDCTLSVTAYPNDHLAHVHGQSYSLKVCAEGKSVMFTGDLSSDFHDFPLAAACGCDLVACELTHYSLASAVGTLASLKAGRLVFYHLHDPWQTSEGRARALELCSGVGYAVSLAYDGFHVEV